MKYSLNKQLPANVRQLSSDELRELRTTLYKEAILQGVVTAAEEILGDDEYVAEGNLILQYTQDKRDQTVSLRVKRHQPDNRIVLLTSRGDKGLFVPGDWVDELMELPASLEQMREQQAKEDLLQQLDVR